MSTTVTEPSESSRCSATNAPGERCGRRAGDNGFCSAHGPNAQNMRELGRMGGLRSPMTKLRKQVAHDEALRQKAKQALEDALDGDDPRRRFEAAKSLYSFRAADPRTADQRSSSGKHDERGVFAIGDLARAAAELGVLGQLGFTRVEEAFPSESPDPVDEFDDSPEARLTR